MKVTMIGKSMKPRARPHTTRNGVIWSVSSDIATGYGLRHRGGVPRLAQRRGPASDDAMRRPAEAVDVAADANGDRLETHADKDRWVKS